MLCPRRRLVRHYSNDLLCASYSKFEKCVICSQRIGTGNEMLLELVLPADMRNGINLENNNYLTTTSSNDGLLNYAQWRNAQSAENRQQDHYFSNDTGYAHTTFSVDTLEYGRPFSVDQSIPPIGSSTQNSCHCTRTYPDKSRIFREYLTKILSSVYALFIVTLGLVVYVSDVIVGNSPIAETFSLCLVVIAFMFLMYLLIDVRIFMNSRNDYCDFFDLSLTEDIELRDYSNLDLRVSTSLPVKDRLQELPHYYCLSKDRHSSSFYLKIGAAGFCLGHLIHSGLLIGYQIVFLTSNGDLFFECESITTLILDILYPVYSFLLLYFLFKYSNIIVNRHTSLARFGIMHCISSSLCFWLWTIFRETIDSLSSEGNQKQRHEVISQMSFYSGEHPAALPLTQYNKRGAKDLLEYLNNTVKTHVRDCDENKKLDLIYRNFSPYLYPFTVEYSILVVGVLFIIWGRVGECKGNINLLSGKIGTKGCESNISPTDNHESNLVLHADCHSANKGLFSGIVVVVISVVSIILFFIAAHEDNDYKLALFINSLTELTLSIFMTIAAVLAYVRLTYLDINKESIALLDDLLLFICLPAFFLKAIFNFIPALQAGNALSITETIFSVIQILVQTPLIIDGLRRCCNTKQLRKQKPGKELITFLIVCNVAMWITQTFEVKSHGFKDHRDDFYGIVLWTILGHMTIPLTMFYRFHSSVCLVHIWKYAYEPSDH